MAGKREWRTVQVRERVKASDAVSLSPQRFRICVRRHEMFRPWLLKPLSIDVEYEDGVPTGQLILRQDPTGWCSVHEYRRVRERGRVTVEMLFYPQQGVAHKLRGALAVPDNRIIYFRPVRVDDQRIRLILRGKLHWVAPAPPAP